MQTIQMQSSIVSFVLASFCIDKMLICWLLPFSHGRCITKKKRKLTSCMHNKLFQLRKCSRSLCCSNIISTQSSTWKCMQSKWGYTQKFWLSFLCTYIYFVEIQKYFLIGWAKTNQMELNEASAKRSKEISV